MYVPRIRNGPNLSAVLAPVLMALGAVVVAIALWGIFHTRSTTNDSDLLRSAPAVAAKSVAYSVQLGDRDFLYVRPLSGDAAPRALTSFPVQFGLNARGAASPVGDRLAVLHLEGGAGALARLTIVPLRGEETNTSGGFDYLSRITWAPDGARLALTRALDANSPGKGAIILEVDARTGSVAERARTGEASQVVPVGYTAGGDTLYVVLVDQAGSSLWGLRGRKFSRITTFSAGLTRDWSLSQDSTRLAFVDRLGAGERSYAGRVLSIATGEVVTIPAQGDQLGAVWRSGTSTPDFGGPAGNLRLTDPDPGAYLIPAGWSSDAMHLVASVVSPGEARESVEIISTTGRVRLAETPGARFLGLVRDE